MIWGHSRKKLTFTTVTLHHICPNWSLFFSFVCHVEFLGGLLLYSRSQTPVPGSRFPVPRFLFPVPRSPFPISRSPFPVPPSYFPLPTSPFPVPPFTFTVPRSPFPVPHFPFPVPRSSFPVPSFSNIRSRAFITCNLGVLTYNDISCWVFI